MTIYNDSEHPIEILGIIPGDPGVPESGALVRIELQPGQAYTPDPGLKEVMIPITALAVDVIVCQPIDRYKEGTNGEGEGNGN